MFAVQILAATLDHVQLAFLVPVDQGLLQLLMRFARTTSIAHESSFDI